MYQLRTKNTKKDPVARWNLPDRVFFACGACHILAYAFSQKYPDSGFQPNWIKPVDGFTGNHIVMVRDNIVFDYHGFSIWPGYFDRYKLRARREFKKWNATLHNLPTEVLVSEARSREYDGLWLREPKQFLHDAFPRAQKYLERFEMPVEFTIGAMQISTK